MNSHEARVYVERDELFAKLERLKTFLMRTDVIDASEEARLRIQTSIMGSYLLVLDQRIANFETLPR